MSGGLLRVTGSQQALRTSTTPPATVGVVVGLEVVLLSGVLLVDVGGAVVVVLDGLGVAPAGAIAA